MLVEGETVGHTFKTNLKYKLHHFWRAIWQFLAKLYKSVIPLAKSFHFQKLSQGPKHISQNVFIRIFTTPLLTVNQMSKRGKMSQLWYTSLTTGSNFPWMPFSPPHFSESTLAFSVIWPESSETEGKSSGDSWEMYSALTKLRDEKRNTLPYF